MILLELAAAARPKRAWRAPTGDEVKPNGFTTYHMSHVPAFDNGLVT